MTEHRYRLIDMAGSEIAVVTDSRDALSENDEVAMPDGSSAIVIEVYDDEGGREGGVRATLVVEDA